MSTGLRHRLSEWMHTTQMRQRRRKVELFKDFIAWDASSVVLDVGSGGAYGPHEFFFVDAFDRPDRLVCIDTHREALTVQRARQPALCGCVVADALHLPFRDGTFAAVHANAVIEHVGDDGAQAAFAREMNRVGRQWYIAAPNRYFPIEPHFRLPLIQFVPFVVQRAIARAWRLGVFPPGAWEEIHLPTRASLKKLFPSSRIVPIRWGGFVQSWVVLGWREAE